MASADHLRVSRQHGLFQHHGIDLGDGTAVHYLEGRQIIRSPIEEFSSGQPLFIVDHSKASSKADTLRRAISRIGEQKYNLLFNNCEHFAHWCKTGKHRSYQTEDLFSGRRIGNLALDKLVPFALEMGFQALENKGLLDENLRMKAIQGLEKLTNFQVKSQKKLDLILEKADLWDQRIYKYSSEQFNTEFRRKLLVQGQILADQLTDVENLQARILCLLNALNSKN